MIHNHERLLVKLVEQYYGRVAAHSAELLLNHGTILMNRAYLLTKLSKNDLKRGVDCLVRQNFAEYTIVKKKKIVTIFPDRMLNILFYPQYIVLVSNKFQPESGFLLRTLMLYGNLSINDIIERTLQHVIISNNLSIEETTMKQFIESLFENFRELVDSKIIISLKIHKDKTASSIDDCDVNAIFTLLLNRNRNLEEFQLSSSSTTEADNNKWTFNCDILKFYQFIQFFPEMLNKQFSHQPALDLFRLLLEMTMEKNAKFDENCTGAELLLVEICKRYKELYPETNMSRLLSIMTMFSHFMAPNFIHIQNEICKLNFYQFLNDTVIVIINEFIRKNFGENAVRIFGALREKTCVFENNLLYELKIDSREFHRNLYQMDQHRIVNMSFFSEASQSAASTARNVRRAFYVNLNESVNYIQKRCFYSLYTSMYRKLIESSTHKDLIARKTTIEQYKKDIETQELDEEAKAENIQTAHSYMSENDHKKAESILKYENKVENVNYHLSNYVFIFSLWKLFNPDDDFNSDIED